MVRPLTKHRKNGEVYTRPRIVEDEIDKVVELGPSALKQRLKISNRDEPDYLSSECLVHLIREAIRTNNQGVIDLVLPRLLSRCETILLVKVPDDEFPDAEGLRDEILSEFGEMLASDGIGENPNILDFYEIRFNLAFKTFRLDRVRAERNRINNLMAISEPLMDDEEENYEDVLVRLSREMQVPATQESAVFLRELWKAIKALPVDECIAFVLCNVLDYKVESQDPNQVTAATLCNCSGRTIRNRLARAAAKLKLLKEELI